MPNPDTGQTPHILVCGAGLAGLSAALAALELGAAVTVIEKGPLAGGSTALSGGVIWTLATFEDMVKVAPGGDPELQRLVIANIKTDRQWLELQGVRLGPIRSVQRYGVGQDCDPQDLVQVLFDRILALNADVRFDTALDRLIVRNGRIVGAKTVNDGRYTDVPADHVVVATGGFQGNPELLRRYVVHSATNLLLRANPWSTGDGLLAASSAGAALTVGLENFYGHALLAPPARFHSGQFQAVSQFYGPHAVALNLNGDRFADESTGMATREAELNQRLAHQPEGRGFYVLDSLVSEMEMMPDSGVVTRVVIERAKAHGGSVVVAQSLDELCDALRPFGVPPGRALNSLSQFNRAIQSGHAEILDPPRVHDHYPLRSAPYYAIAVQAGITFTMGGLAVDSGMGVLRRSASSSPLAQFIRSERDYRAARIQGLWAAGGDVGNISHVGYMGGLGPALVTGRAAGTSAALEGT